MWKILRVNMSNLTVTEEAFKADYLGLGGRGLIAQVLTDEVEPTCDPLGAGNKLIFSTPVFVGTGLSCANRLSVGCKSPLTGGIKEANVGGTLATFMAGHGIRLIIVEGQPKSALWHLHIDAMGDASIVDANKYQGVNNYQMVESLIEQYGDVSVASIGCAGERMYRNSTVQITDYGTNKPCRAAARGGVGAVMGAKRVKAVVIEKAKNRYSPEYVDKEMYKKMTRELNKVILQAAVDFPLRLVGTPDGVARKQEHGVLPVRNFSGKKLENIEGISSAAFMDIIKKRGRNGMACQVGCAIRCSNQVDDEEGNHLTGSIEYETVALCGANCCITNYDAILRMDRLCDDLGIDTIETGATIGVCMEAGKIPWGDGDAAISLIEEMKAGTDFGQLMGQGTEAVGKYLGVSRIPVAKHQSLAGYDPRGAVITGVAYATSAMGGDHTVGPVEGTCSGMSPEEVCNLSKNLQTMFAMTDSLICGFAWIFWNKHIDKMATLYASIYGGPALPERLQYLGAETLTKEKEFNNRAGWTHTDDILPDFFYTQKSEITGITFTIPQEIMAKTMDS